MTQWHLVLAFAGQQLGQHSRGTVCYTAYRMRQVCLLISPTLPPPPSLPPQVPA